LFDKSPPFPARIGNRVSAERNVLAAGIIRASLARMTSRFIEIVIDAHDVKALADFWCAVLDYKIIDQEHGLIEIAPRDYPDEWNEATIGEFRAQARRAPRAPSIVFIPVPEHKTVKNRLHIDVSPIGSQAEEVARLESLGATKADIGQAADVSWVVMRDPEGNEFCILRSLES
jgi:hypothetical protein